VEINDHGVNFTGVAEIPEICAKDGPRNIGESAQTPPPYPLVILQPV